MSVILLPIEAVNCAFEAGTANGSDVAKWTSPTKNSLGDLVTDLSEFKQKVDVTSIPDIWAGPKAFEAQLIDDVEDQRTKWRAVLAIIGLRKVMRFNLKIKAIKVPKVGSPVYNNKNTHPFLKVVARLMDKEFTNYPGGDTIHLICSGSKTIAMVWPNSIIYPISGAGVNVPWWDGVKFHDPSQNKEVSEQEVVEAADKGEEPVVSGWLSEQQRYILAKWLKKIRNSVALGSTSTATEISGCLKNYIKDLGFNMEEIPDEDDPEKLVFTDEDKDFVIAGYGSMLSQVYSTPSSKEDLDLSNIRLDCIDKKKKRHILVIDKAIAEQWKMQASNIVCFGATDLGSAIEMIGNESKKRQFLEECKLANYGAELWTADDFFTNKIAYITGFAANANPFPNSLTETDEYKGKFCFDFGKNNLQEFILPIRKEVLDFIAPEDLVKNITIERESSNSPIKVTLLVELSGCGTDGTKQAVLLSKVYEEADIVKRTAVPNVQIWPNFKADCWKQYYVFTGTALEPNLTIEPAWTDEKLENGEKVENLNFEIKAREIKVRLRRGAKFPSIFVCKNIEKQQADPVGLICMNEANLEVPKDSNERKTSYIGVDFGTTNSVVYYANNFGNDALREQMHFEDRHFAVTRVKEDNKDDLRRYFLPASQQPETVKGVTTNSIRTIFHDFNLADENQIENFEQPLVWGNIYYLENGQNVSDDLVVIDELKGNIKWDNKQEEDTNEKRMHAFVHQLCMQAMAEAVMKGAKKVFWQYSWPTAYDEDKQNNYAKFWTTTLVDAMNDIASLSNSEDVRQKTESLSMADYFQKGVDENDRANAFSKGLLTIDIGGGSTDIAVWKGNNGKDQLRNWHQCSFKLAGTDIFSNYIKTKYRKVSDLLSPLGANNRSLREKFDKLTELAQAAKDNAGSWKTFELELESILKYSERELIQGMGVTAFSGRQYQELNTVMRDIAFALGGIFYYAGEIIGHLRKDPDGTINCTINRGLPDCFVGGNGSKLLDWASKGAFAQNDKLKVFLRDCIVWGMLDCMQIKGSELNGFGVNPSIKQSELPKHEVSFGLISGEGNKPNEDTSENVDGFMADPDDGFGDLNSGFDSNFDSGFGGNGSSDFDDIDDAQSISGNVEAEANKHKNKSYPVISGELYFTNGSNESSDDEMITVDNFTNRKKRISVDFNPNRNRFIRYCKVFNHEVGKYHLFNGKNIVFNNTRGTNDLANIFDKVANELESRETRTGKGVIVEPIFIMELREAMKKLSNY